MLSRRSLLIAISAYFGTGASQTLTLREMIMHPLLRGLYSHGIGKVAPDGRTGLNFEAYNTIEEQRQGTEWIINGLVSRRPDWVALGWKVLDYGIDRQQPDGGFGAQGYLHANALVVEALARACLLDPEGATEPRRQCLARGAAWLMSPTERDLAINAPYAHRRYILAAAAAV